MICKVPYLKEIVTCFVGRFLKKGRIVKQCYVCRRFEIDGKMTYKIGCIPTRVDYEICPKCLPGEVERVGKLIEREMREAEIGFKPVENL